MNKNNINNVKNIYNNSKHKMVKIMPKNCSAENVFSFSSFKKKQFPVFNSFFLIGSFNNKKRSFNVDFFNKLLMHLNGFWIIHWEAFSGDTTILQLLISSIFLKILRLT